MKRYQSDFHSYLLRLWRVRDDEQQWRAALEDVQTGEMRGFAEFEALVMYLQALTAQDDPQPAALAEQKVSGR